MGIPSNAVGLLLFVALLWPGFVYSTIHARRRPQRAPTPLAELVSIVSASLTALSTVGLIFLLVRAAWPSTTPDVHALTFDTRAYLTRHGGLVAGWGAGLLAVAIVGAAGVAAAQGSPRLAQARGLRRLFTSPVRDTEMSGWWVAFGRYDPKKVTVHVGCTLSDGSWVSGRLHSYSQREDDVADRDLVLAAPIRFRSPGHDDPTMLRNVELMVISARQLVHLTVSPVRRTSPATAATAETAQP